MTRPTILLGTIVVVTVGIILWRVMSAAPLSSVQSASPSLTQSTSHIVADGHHTANLPATMRRDPVVEQPNLTARRTERARPLPPPTRVASRHQVDVADASNDHERALAALREQISVLSVGIDVPGQEFVVIGIEGRPDQVLAVNAEVRDGFIVCAITDSGVVLASPFGGDLFLPLSGSDYSGQGQVQLAASSAVANPGESAHGAVQHSDNAQQSAAEPPLRIPPFRYYGPGHHVSPASEWREDVEAR